MKENSLLTCVRPKESLSENKIVGKILEMEIVDIMDYFLPADCTERFLFLKDCLLGVFPEGFSETPLFCLKFSRINPLVLQKFELPKKVSLKADNIP